MQSVHKLITSSKMFKAGDVVGVACSGGVDSMSLLHYLNSVKDEFDIEVVAINVDHSIRDNSAEDSAFVQTYCRENRIRCYKFKIDSIKISKEKKICLEEAARIGRYGVFDSLMQKEIVDKICLGHHMQDQAETILLNIFRGSGLNGASGMEVVRDGYLRPMLNTQKLEITQYASNNEVPFVEDDSNFDESYSRNYLRHIIMPKLRLRWYNLDKNIVDFGKICKEDDNYIKSQMFFDGIIRDQNLVRIPLSYFIYSAPIVNRMLLKELEYLKVNKDIEKKHLNIIEEMALEAKNGTKISLPNQITIHKEYDFIAISVKLPKPKLETIDFRLGTFKLVNFGELTVRKTTKFDIINNSHLLDSEKLPKGCVIRTREEGDMFTKFGGGTKKLKDYFIDKKIPQRLRSEIPLICKDNEVYCILGVEISDKVKVDENTKSAYILTTKVS
ncbi:MAG: tRNA lysidine(34) synthetase TilS [Clostridiales bacterium]|nr:tRNA lysidine(34) synthetase TilS [Clostridiales bacterium]